MTFTYVVGAAKKDDVRLLIADVDDSVTPELRLEDEDINRIIQLEGGLYIAAARAAEVLSSKFARKAEGSQGPDRIVASGRAMELRMLAGRLRSSGAALAIPSCPAISISAKAATEADPDKPAAAFKTGMLDNPDAAGTQSQ